MIINNWGTGIQNFLNLSPFFSILLSYIVSQFMFYIGLHFIQQICSELQVKCILVKETSDQSDGTEDRILQAQPFSPHCEELVAVSSEGQWNANGRNKMKNYLKLIRNEGKIRIRKVYEDTVLLTSWEINTRCENGNKRYFLKPNSMHITICKTKHSVENAISQRVCMQMHRISAC